MIAANNMAQKIKKLVHFEGKTKGLLKDLGVEVAPQGVPTPNMDYVFHLTFVHMKNGVITEQHREQLREFVLNGLGAKIKSVAGWGGIRIRTCARQENAGKYLWFVEPRN